MLERLADQLSEGEARRLALDLPDVVAPQQVPRRRRKGAHPVRVTDFVRQVSERTGLTDEEARAGAGAVLAVLREALGEEEYRHLIGQLPRSTPGWCKQPAIARLHGQSFRSSISSRNRMAASSMSR